jgi:translation initiation factor IF-3
LKSLKLFITLKQEETTINPKFSHKDNDNIRINFRIRAREVRVIGADGSQLGILDTKKAIELAQSQGLDLAEVSPTSVPPVCKILDYGKYKYQQKKKAQQSKKNQVVILLKEIQLRPNTDSHDVDFKVKHTIRFLEEGHKVKVSVRFKGRESAHSVLGYNMLNQVIDLVGNLGIVEQTAKMEGKILSIIFAPNKVKKPAKSEVAKATKTVAQGSPTQTGAGS